MIIVYAQDFQTWREVARKLLQENVAPEKVFWNEINGQSTLFHQQRVINPEIINVKVSNTFLKLAELICYHRKPERFDLLYQMLWRLVHENKHLLKISSDPLTNNLELMAKAIKRDVHKTKAFVRFRKNYDENNDEHFIAWHKPDHYSLKLSAPFFQRRFTVMRWAILTPDESVYWDMKSLHFGPGAKNSEAPSFDQMEELWKEFYRAIFNPARIKIKAMKREMPVRHWPTLPETSIIPEMLAEASIRVKNMIAHQEGYAFSANDFIPNSLNLYLLKEAAAKCKGCPLYRDTTQAVFGNGPANASLMMVGEQPGNEEDIKGEPFIGPAGQILEKALKEAGLNRDKIYLTNAVKHFKFEYQNDFRLHRTPSMKDIINCKPWLEAELKSIKPKLIVCLGLTAAKSLISPRFKLDERGKFFAKDNYIFLATYHPSAVLRSNDSKNIYDLLVQDLNTSRVYLNL